MPATDDRILTVGELTQAIKETLAEAFPAVWVRGELSGFKRADSGHLYFSLKEGKDAVLSCAMWRQSAVRVDVPLRDGLEIEAFGRIDVFAPRGNYQLIVQALRPAGLGALLLQLEELKRRLAAEGLFDAARKRPLPRYPARIGVVTSPVGAAIRDIVKVLRSRWPGIGLVIAPVKVQGEGAAAEIASAIERFNRHGGVDLLIVGRGGGSIEDLWAFNEEPVVRAIAGSAIPVISAVGHEVDVTLADLAADVRAATPSNAAEIAVRDAADVRHRVAMLADRAAAAARLGLERRRRELTRLLDQYGFRRVRDVFTSLQQRIDGLRERLDAASRERLARARDRLARARLAYGLREGLPRRLEDERARLARGTQALGDAIVALVHEQRRRATAYGDRLRALSPRHVLERGYALVRDGEGRFVRAAAALAPGQSVTLEFARGEADATVTTIREGGNDAR